jgi:ribosomal protein S18 acetylase RimI-like enzyme
LSVNIVKETSLSTVQIGEIRALVNRSNKKDNTSYVFDGSDDFKKDEDINSFLLYDNRKLTGFISIFSPKKIEAEITTIIEPEQRRRGYFTKLLFEVENELKRRNIYSILFVCDCKSKDGNSAVEKMGTRYEYSEYLMTYAGDRGNRIPNDNKVNVIEASRNDMDRLISINKSVFKSDEEEAFGFVEENFQNHGRNLYSIINENKIVGMIGVYAETDRQYIYGFCIERKYQGMGIGKQSLTSIVEICRQNNSKMDICLEVRTDNENALKLYIDVGFKLVTEFKYYRKSL